MNETEQNNRTVEGKAVEGNYEQRDMNLRVVGAFLGGVVLMVVAVFLVVLWMFDDFAVDAARHHKPLSPLAETQQIPAGPLLQVTPHADLKAFRASEHAVLHSYGWIDPKAGIVRIPIGRAMKLLAERGLPIPAPKAKPS